MEIEVVDFVVVKFIGIVQEVCQAKGCWMIIVFDDLDVEFIMVCFKDYGFFMFKDIVGCKVIMDGYVFVEEILVDELCYYVEDVGKLQEEIEVIIEFKKEMKFLVSGVLLLEEQKFIFQIEWNCDWGNNCCGCDFFIVCKFKKNFILYKNCYFCFVKRFLKRIFFGFVCKYFFLCNLCEVVILGVDY